MLDSLEFQFELHSIFSPASSVRSSRLFQERRPVAHYTTAENAMNILKGQSIWLRNMRYMNDFEEFDHGFEMLVDFFDKDRSGGDVGREQYIAAVDEVFPGSWQAVSERFNQYSDWFRNRTYVACVTEHSSGEINNGRLSMWRGYGRNVPAVSLVIDPSIFFTVTDDVGAYSSAVLYLEKDELFDDLRASATMIRDKSEMLRVCGSDNYRHFLFQSLFHYAVCLKHSGFNEEREWRITHVPGFNPAGVMNKAVEAIRGRPQLVYKIPLVPNVVGEKLSVNRLLSKIIVGPTEEPEQIQEAFVELLSDLGVEGAAEKVVVSKIPFRDF